MFTQGQFFVFSVVLLGFNIKCQQKDVLGDSAIVTAGMQTGHTCKMLDFVAFPKPIKSPEKCLK